MWRRFVASLIILVIAGFALGFLDLVLQVHRGVEGFMERQRDQARAALAPSEVPGPPFIAENLAWRNIEHFTMRPGLIHGPEYRMDGYGLRMHWASGPQHDRPFTDRRMDRHDEDRHLCRFQVWLFGGSTVMGLGLAQQHSLPAQLETVLNSTATLRPVLVDWREWCVYNLGMGSQESTQELLLFWEMLQHGHRPDLVIFYDGVNESLGAAPWDFDSEPIRRLRAGRALDSLRAAISQQSGLVWAWRALWRPAPRPPTPNDAELMIRRYVLNVALRRGMAEALGIPALFIWQPAQAYEHGGVREWTSAEHAMWIAVGNPADALRHEAFLRWSLPRVHDLTGVFVGVREQVWMDPRHPNSHGTWLIAKALVPLVKGALHGSPLPLR